jgi:lysophospholipase L1-like esterase
MLPIFNDQALSHVKTAFRRTTVDLSKLLLAALLLEGMLQVIAPEYKNNVFDREFTGGRPIAMSSAGNRGPLLPIQKPPGEVRILGMGDSTTFGTGIGAEDTWPAQLATVFQKNGAKATYINSAIEGSTVKEINYVYRNQWSAYKPDVVVLAVDNNMVSMTWFRREDKGAPKNPYLEPAPQSKLENLKTGLKQVTRVLASPSWLRINSQKCLYLLGLSNNNIKPEVPLGATVASGWKQANVPPDLPERVWKQFEEDLSVLRDSVAADGRSLVVLYLPARFMAFDGFSDNEQRVPKNRLTIDAGKRLGEISQSLGVRYLDGTEPVRRGRSQIAEKEGRSAPMYIKFDSVHLDKDGNQAVAEGLFELVSKSEKAR